MLLDPSEEDFEELLVGESSMVGLLRSLWTSGLWIVDCSSYGPVLLYVESVPVCGIARHTQEVQW
jgi:hypothetical protein